MSLVNLISSEHCSFPPLSAGSCNGILMVQYALSPKVSGAKGVMKGAPRYSGNR